VKIPQKFFGAGKKHLAFLSAYLLASLGSEHADRNLLRYSGITRARLGRSGVTVGDYLRIFGKTRSAIGAQRLLLQAQKPVHVPPSLDLNINAIHNRRQHALLTGSKALNASDGCARRAELKHR
jgi:hypothetical protein